MIIRDNNYGRGGDLTLQLNTISKQELTGGLNTTARNSSVTFNLPAESSRMIVGDNDYKPYLKKEKMIKANDIHSFINEYISKGKDKNPS